jgi:subtilisin-like proprotein convertase family protein
MDPEEIKIQDKFEVKIIELDLWGLRIYTELVRRIES